jgi:anaerobic selenocysteine-containing dehydrogenase
VTKSWLGSDNAFKNLRAMLKTNQNGGFDCPGCAWGESPESDMVKFCENGAKAVNWEATGRSVDPAFFARYSVSALKEQTDYWLEYQGRDTRCATTRPPTTMSKPPGTAFADRPAPEQPESPDEAEFYTSGRASNEAAFLYQLFVRAYGTNNFPDCSNMCHEASGVGMSQTLGVGKGTVVFHDLELADAIFVIGQNPGTNHPRMLEPLREAVKRGAQVVCFNPLKERGLERFQHPQHPLEMLSNGSEPTSTAYFRPALGGDMAAMRGIAKFLLQWEREAQPRVSRRCSTTPSSPSTPAASRITWPWSTPPWEQIVEQSGLTLAEIELAARTARPSGSSCAGPWAPSTAIRWRPCRKSSTCSCCAATSASPAPACRRCAATATCRATAPWASTRNPRRAARRPGKALPVQGAAHGDNAVLAIKAMEEGRAKVFVALGGNFAQATPDTPRTRRCAAR